MIRNVGHKGTSSTKDKCIRDVYFVRCVVKLGEKRWEMNIISKVGVVACIEKKMQGNRHCGLARCLDRFIGAPVWQIEFINIGLVKRAKRWSKYDWDDTKNINVK